MKELDWTSFPTHFVDSKKIKLIHHGMASPDRCIQNMIEMMRYVDSRFSLDLMLVPTYHKEYFAQLEAMAKDLDNVRMLPIVSFEEIIPFSAQYDIGIFLVPPTTYNLKMCLPNKFFEFIQARLAIAIGPSPEMARYVKEYHLGIIAKDFTPQSMAQELNKLTKQDILKYKENANKTARILNAEKEGEKILALLEKVAG
ncbi:hypothetical protein [Helicobacter turcicus]|uniref:Glycosyltransferase n=1 Tax=Helicobacter turcicus TaxID=2867412 RepID=A0ABS7JQ88_9HELI|nr:hypothetical protein [Helicobacter turcicus]MBX7491575.1 hypothetical protein [Helicobacter turcicus]MBX7546424.1 hypothetical protein [Helicobacter turcicus]